MDSKTIQRSFFKKAFINRIVFKVFVEDIIGIEMDPEKIKTEKSFQPKSGKPENALFFQINMMEDLKKVWKQTKKNKRFHLPV